MVKSLAEADPQNLMRIPTWRKSSGLGRTGQPATALIDTSVYQESWLERQAQLHFFAYYYDGSIYRQAAEWARGNAYSPSVTPPSIYLNYARLIIDRLSAFSFDRVRGVALGEETISSRGESPLGEEAASPAATFLGGFLHHSQFLQQLTSIAREALLFGDVLLRLVHTPASSFPLAFSLIPAEEFDYEHDPRDIGQVRFVRREFRYSDAAGVLRIHREDILPDRCLYYRDEVQSGSHLLRRGKMLAMTVLGGGRPQPLAVEREVLHPFGFIPAVHLKNRPRPGEKFGESELADLTPILDDINWKVSQRSRNISRTMNAILKNVNGRLVQDQLDDTQIVTVLGDGAQLEYLVNDSDIGAVQTHLEELKQALTHLTGVVMMSPEKLTSVGPLSGFALSILYEPLINAAKSKRRTLGSGIERFLQMVLEAGARLGQLTQAEASAYAPRLSYEPDLHFSEAEKLTRLKRELLAKQSGLASDAPLTATDES